MFLVRPLIGVFYGNEVSFVTEESIEPIDCDVVYLDDNGVTIKAYPCANIGDVGIVNGVEYTVVDNDMLYEIRGEFGQTITADFTRLCTTRVTNMDNLFLCSEEFNQPIGNWDVSNVTNMSFMFANECDQFHSFNQDISFWDVSNVTNMSGMFSMANFNQDISQWDVSNVTNMNSMFYRSDYFNQPLHNWDVSNVTDMSFMFYITLNFNQDISQWNVSNVTNMRYMFERNTSFNRDLSVWSVQNVMECDRFSYNTPQWTLPQPNFTNCNPN